MAFATHFTPGRWGGEFTTSCAGCGHELRPDPDPARAEAVVNLTCPVCRTKPPRRRPGGRTPNEDLARPRLASRGRLRTEHQEADRER